MTAEIAILNKGAVALAADSAVTIGRQKVYNSANKLFTLSKIAPVGVMVYDSAEVMGLPWETIIKYFRNRVLGRTRHPTVAAYKDALLEFLRTTTIFTKGHEELHVRKMFAAVLSNVLKEGREQLKILAASRSDQAFTETEAHAAFEIAIKKVLDDYEKREFVGKANEELAKKFGGTFVSQFKEAFDVIFQQIPLSDSQKAKLLRCCILVLVKDRFMVSSGIVIAGFGDDEIFPSLESVRFEARIGSYLKVKKTHAGSIDLSRTAWIVPFAQSEMVATFMNGIHPALKNVLTEYMHELFTKLPAVLYPDAADVGKQAPLATELAKLARKFEEKVAEYSQKNYIQQILDSVTALPKDELAAMAEALVNLTSFRRRVTLDQETVGGPIDVAVISKGDGFIWIKRKHYFDPNLNQHFEANYFRGV